MKMLVHSPQFRGIKSHYVNGESALADYPPFVNAYGQVPKILNKIKDAGEPDRFTQDFLSTVLGFKGAGAKAFIPFAKRLGFLAGDGSPTVLYRKFRNPSESRAAMAMAIKNGYPEYFSRNEHADKLNPKELEGLTMEITGLQRHSQTAKSIIRTIEALKSFADFDSPVEPREVVKETQFPVEITHFEQGGEVGMNLSYTINLVLPKTDDMAVFNAIFKSIREHLLKK